MGLFMSHLGVFDTNHTLWWDFLNPSLTWNTLIGGIRRRYQVDVSRNEGIKGRNAYYFIWKLWSLAVLALVLKGLTPKLNFVMVYFKKVTSKVYLHRTKLEILMSHYTVCFLFSSSHTKCAWLWVWMNIWEKSPWAKDS